jgi:paraquat-inducible protein B
MPSGPIIEKKRGISPVWILPLVAICVGGWLLYKNYKDAGIDITVHVKSAAELTAGKTPVVFKGTQVGLVKKIEISADLQGVDLNVEMDKATKPYLVEDVKFWIETAEIGAGKITGLETLIKGGYIGMQLGESKKPARSFVALSNMPPVPLSAPGLHFTLKSDALYSLQVGSGIYYRNITIGSVQSYTLQKDDSVLIDVFIQPEYALLVKKESHFWNASGITVSGGIANLKVHIPSLAAIVKGGIMMENPSAIEHNPPLVNGQVLPLYKDFETAQYGIPLSLDLPTGEGIIEGSTKVMYKGMVLGHVRQIALNNSDDHTVTASVLLDPRAKSILNSGTRFYLIKPEFSITGVSHLETLVNGAYLTFTPGKGEPQDHFIVQNGNLLSDFARTHSDGLVIHFKAADLGSIAIGSPILYKKVEVGEVTGFRLREKEDDVLISATIIKRYAHLVKKTSRFYNASGIDATASLADGFKIETGTLATLVAGGVSFYSPVKAGDAQAGTLFTLYEDFNAAANSDKVKIVVHCPESDGLKVGTKIRYHGIAIGEVAALRYEEKLTMVRLEAMLDPEVSTMLTVNTKFSLVRPEFSLSGAQDLKTLIEGPYLNMVPGEGTAKREFTVVPEYQAEEKDIKGLHVILEADDLYSLKTGDPIYYRRVKVGEIRDFQLAPTFEKVYLNGIIYEQFKLLICENTRFWNVSGIQLSGGIFSGLNLSIESLESLVTGGIALATPDEEEMGAFVKSGHHFKLYAEAEESWHKWQPKIERTAPKM